MSLPRNSRISLPDLKGLHNDVYQWALFCSDFERDSAHEIVQLTYLKVLEGKAVYKGKSQLKTWLFGVVRLTSLELKRKSIRESHHSNEQVLNLEEQSAIQEDEFFSGFPESVLASAIYELSLTQREIIYLHFYKELSLSEVALTLESSTGAISSQYDRAKKKLQRILTNWSPACEKI